MYIFFLILRETKEWINKNIGGHYQIAYFYLDTTNAFLSYSQMSYILQVSWPGVAGKGNVIWGLSLL